MKKAPRRLKSDAASAGVRTLYPAPAADRRRLREAMLAETLRAGPAAVLVPVVLVALLAACFHDSPHGGEGLMLLGLVSVPAGLAILAAWFCARRAASPRVIDLGPKIACCVAVTLGTSLAAMIVLLLPAAPGDDGLLVLGVLCAAMASAGLLGPSLQLRLFYLAPLLLGGTLALLLRADAGAIVDAVVLLMVLITMGGGQIALHRRFCVAWERRLVDGRRVAEQVETIEFLLLDFESRSDVWLWETSASGVLRQVPDAMAESIGLPRAKAEGMRFKALFTSRCQTAAPSAGAIAVRAAMVDRKPFRDILVEIKTAGEPIWWRLSGKPFHDEAGALQGFRGICADVTAARADEARIAYLANHDALTGLVNRGRFRGHVGAGCAAAKADGRWRALLHLDLDGFKSVNDHFGHAAGDRLLRTVAERLAAAIPPGALLARLGGDEFAVWHEARTPARAEALADTLIRSLTAPFDIDGSEINLGASVGIVFAPRDGLEPDALFGRADLALHRAKSRGKGCHHVFVRDDEQVVLERRALEQDIKLALARGEFELHYQPLVDAARGDVVCFEALIRWRSPTRGSVSPAEFIPAAEASGLITAIGRWVLSRACADAARWPRDVRVAVNVSPRQVGAADFVASVTTALSRAGLSASRLEIEVTEGVFLDHSATAIAHLSALREQGICVALDDFGTGYSSLSYLTRFPVDKIKIDRSFVRDFVTRPESQAIVDAILTLARNLGIKVTAEGVETPEQALALKLRRCDDLQGFLFSKPRPEADVAEMIAGAPAVLRAIIPPSFESPLALVLRKSA